MSVEEELAYSHKKLIKTIKRQTGAENLLYQPPMPTA